MVSAMVNLVLAVHCADIERLGLLRLMGVIGAGIDTQITELHAAERTARQHALDRLLDDPLGKFALEDRLGGAFLDAADKIGVVVIDFLFALAPRQHDLSGVDNDDVVAVINMGRVGGLVLAAQPHGDDRGEAADDQARGIDQQPLLLHIGWFGGNRGHRASIRAGAEKRGSRASNRGLVASQRLAKVFYLIKSIGY